MNSLESNKNVCRICLDYNVIINWNDEIFESYGISYKDCYYKYVKLSENDSEGYPTELCQMCASELKKAHILFEKALESYNILRVARTAKYVDEYEEDMQLFNGQQKVQYKIDTSDENKPTEFNLNSSLDDKTFIEMSPVYDNEKIDNTENEIKKEFPMIEDAASDAAECRHFIDIKNWESCAETPLQQLLIENDQTDLNKLAVKNATSKRKKYKTLSEQQLADFSKSSATENPDQKIYQSSEDPLLKQNLSECCDTESSEASPTKRRKPEEKLCQYCSRKVKGINHLIAHEATHRENRERNETCPQCGIKLFTKLALTEHMKIHKENRQKNHKCEFCEKAFFHKGALNVHRRIHLGQMVKCHICSKEFYRQVDLNKHMQAHSANPLQKKLLKCKYTVQCQYCNKSIWTNMWKAHKAEHLNKPQMKCTICDKIFFSRTSCTKHLKKKHRKREYDQYIHYFVDSYPRMSNLMIRQQESVQTLAK